MSCNAFVPARALTISVAHVRNCLPFDRCPSVMTCKTSFQNYQSKSQTRLSGPLVLMENDKVCLAQGCLSYDVQVALKIEKTGERIKRDMAASFVWRRLPTKKNA